MFKIAINFNTKEVEANLLKAVAKAGITGMRGCSAAVDKIILQSLMEVPRLSGALASSVYKIVNKKTINFGYGGPNVQENPRGISTEIYAVRVHEDLTARHPNGGKAKFLEDPIRTNQLTLLAEIANYIRLK